ncbi:hypothetical protein [Streptomyces sp. NPDC017524]|uniref:hypothetical protein n=1 Tax=Streptomyces sp. NPDC017524 TaxID=3364999 RepID=UPI0037AC9F18
MDCASGGLRSQHIDLRYVLQPASARTARALPAGQIHAGEHPSPGEGSLPDMLAYYRATRPVRLVLTGPARPGPVAGAGKATRL